METDTATVVPEKPVVREYGPEDLEPTNFRIDSSGWEERTDPNGIRFLTNPEGDVTELLDGPYAGEQHFQNAGAMGRELAKAGKRTMLPEEWKRFAERHADWMLANLPLAGYRAISSAAYGYQGTYGYYWASSLPGKYGHAVTLSSVKVDGVEPNHRTFGLSVRCLKH